MFLRIYWLPLTVFIVGLLSLTMLIGLNRINERQSRNYDVCDVLMDIQIKIQSTHILVDEIIFGDAPIDIEKVSVEIDLAISLAEALLKGGKSEHGKPLQPLDDSKLRKRVGDIYLWLTQFKTFSLQRITDLKMARTSPDLYEHFHATSSKIQDEAEALEVVLEKKQIISQARANRLHLGIFLAWIFIVLCATAGLWHREARRRAAEEALEKTNGELQSRSEELRNHRERLMELVEERTAELTSANRNLQQEIIERAEAEKSLQATENKCRILVDHLPQKIFLKDMRSVYVYSNESFARDFNIKATGIVGKTDFDLFSQETAEKNRSEDRRVIESGKPVDSEGRQDHDGQETIIHIFKMPIRNEKREITGILGFSWDVTERVRLEAVAEAVTTMNNIGYIFEGVRHEIGNPIASAKISLNVLKERIDDFSQETVKEYIERVLGEIAEVQYLLNTLKSFNMYEALELQNVKIGSFMEKFLHLLTDGFEKAKGIAIETIFDPEAQWVSVDPRALQQVLLNIMSNAADALEGKENPRIVIQISKMGSTIRITVTDNGSGIPIEKMKRLYTPFFTTKPSGTGMGLVIAKKLLSGMGGTISIKTGIGEGTSIEISIQEGKGLGGTYSYPVKGIAETKLAIQQKQEKSLNGGLAPVSSPQPQKQP